MMEKFDLKQTKVHRTLEGMLIEVACAIMLAAMWALTWRYWHASDMLESRIIVCVAVTIMTVFLLVSAYFPSYLAWSFPLNNINAVGRAVRVTRYWALAGLLATVIGLVGWGTMKPGLGVFIGCGLVLKWTAAILEFKNKDEKEKLQ